MPIDYSRMENFDMWLDHSTDSHDYLTRYWEDMRLSPARVAELDEATEQLFAERSQQAPGLSPVGDRNRIGIKTPANKTPTQLGLF